MSARQLAPPLSPLDIFQQYSTREVCALLACFLSLCIRWVVVAQLGSGRAAPRHFFFTLHHIRTHIFAFAAARRVGTGGIRTVAFLCFLDFFCWGLLISRAGVFVADKGRERGAR